MKEKINKIIKTGYGLGLLSVSQAKKTVSQVKKDLKLSEKESLRLANELVASSEKVAIDVLKTVDKHFSSALIKTKVVKKKDISRVKKLLKKRLLSKLKPTKVVKKKRKLKMKKKKQKK